MTTNVSDKFSNLNDNLTHAAKVLTRSKPRRDIFEVIYRGKRAVKTQEEIRKATAIFVQLLELSLVVWGA